MTDRRTNAGADEPQADTGQHPESEEAVSTVRGEGGEAVPEDVPSTGSQLIPDGWDPFTTFVAPDLPDVFTMRCYRPGDNPTDALEDGPYDARNFLVEDGTNVAYTDGDGGHPVFLRVVEQYGTTLNCVDGAGEPIIYELQRVPDNTLPEPEDAPVSLPSKVVL